MSREEYHISSLVLHGRPSEIGAIQRAVNEIPGAEVHAVSQEGKMVVTLETQDEQGILKRLHEINLIDGVISAGLVYHQVD